MATVEGVTPQPVDLFIVQPSMGIGNAVGLNNSINSSFPPPVPSVRNSLITIPVAGVRGVVVAVGVTVAVAVLVEVGVTVTVDVMVVVGVIVVVGEIVGVGVMVGVEVGGGQIFIGELLFRGVGVPVAKSVLLLSTSVHPLVARISDSVALSAGAAALPSKKLAVRLGRESSVCRHHNN